MDHLVTLLIFKGYLIFFLWILANRIGIPLPATPALLAAGALAGMGRWPLTLVLALAVSATLISDSAWFELSRRYGSWVLQQICRWSADPKGKATRTETFLSKHGSGSLLIAKFIPGMNRTVMSLTGPAKLGFAQFLILDFFGAVLWVGTYVLLGYAFCDALQEAVRHSMALGRYAVIVFCAAVALSIFGWLLLQRRQRMPGQGPAIENQQSF